MILHLINDEKIVNNLILSFETGLKNQNLFIIFTEEEKLFHTSPNDRIVIYRNGKLSRNCDFTQFNKVYIHYLDIKKIRFFNKYIKHNVTVYWGIFGGDLYNTLLDSRGYRLYSKNNSYTKSFSIKSLIKKVFCYTYFASLPILNFIRTKVDYLCGDSGDVMLLAKYFGIQKKCIDSFAYPYDKVLGNLVDCRIRESASNILCGNSASYTNNHEYVLEHLKRIGLNEEYNIIMPLSYGGDKKYVSSVVKRGLSYFNNKFKFILDFLPLEEYNQLFLNTKICVFGSWRQEAFGNILTALYLGVKVYLSEFNPFLISLEEKGFKVFILENATNESFYEDLSQEDMQINRQIITQNYSFERKIYLLKRNYSE